MRYTRRYDLNRRIHRGDDDSMDAWEDTETGKIVYTVVGFDINKPGYLPPRDEMDALKGDEK